MGGQGSGFPGEGTAGLLLQDAREFRPPTTKAGRIGRRRKPFPTTQDTGQPDWLTTFINTAIEPDHSKGECHYASLPTNTAGNCQIP